MPDEPQVSVIICTHNRAGYLDECLGSIASQNTANRFEVVVIDNASQDHTGEILAAWCARDSRFRTAKEPQLGQSVAKNLGVKMAKAPLILFTDDDVIVEPDWISAYVTFFSKQPSEWLVAGGKVVPVADDLAPWPLWCASRGVNDIGLLDYQAEKVLPSRHYVWGNNMAVPKIVFERFGLWDEHLGHKGAQRGTFEDVAFQDRVREHDLPVWFCPSAVLRHRIKRTTITPRRVIGTAFSRGLGDFWEKSAQEWGAIERAPRVRVTQCTAALLATMVWWSCAAAVFSIVRNRTVFESARRAARSCGWWFGVLGAGRRSDKRFQLAKTGLMRLQKRLLRLISDSPPRVA